MKPATEFKRRVTGLEAKIQRKIAKAIKRSRQIALMPYTRIEK